LLLQLLRRRVVRGAHGGKQRIDGRSRGPAGLAAQGERRATGLLLTAACAAAAAAASLVARQKFDKKLF